MFLYVKNLEENDLIIEGLNIWLAANEYIDVYINDTGTPAGGTVITASNLNSGKGRSLAGTFQSGNNITGLTKNRLAYRIYHASSNKTTNYNFECDIVLAKNGILTLYCQTGTTALAGFLDMYIHP